MFYILSFCQSLELFRQYKAFHPSAPKQKERKLRAHQQQHLRKRFLSLQAGIENDYNLYKQEVRAGKL